MFHAHYERSKERVVDPYARVPLTFFNSDFAGSIQGDVGVR